MTAPVASDALAPPAAFRPGSRASAIWGVFAHAWAGRGAALTVVEARAAFAVAEGATPVTFTAEVHSLVRRAYLVAEGAASPRRYRPAGRAPGASAAEAAASPTAALAGPGADRPVAPRSDAERVYAALVAACEAAGAAVTTRAVAQELEARGWALDSADPNAVRSRLINLTRPLSARRARWGAPTVRHVAVTGPDGRARSNWAPGDRPAFTPPAVAVASQADAGAQLVRETTAALGRPASRPELLIALRVRPAEDPVRALLEPRGGRPRLARVLRAAERSEGPDRGPRVYAVATDPVAHGGAPVRFWCGDGRGAGEPISDAGWCAMQLDDWAERHRPVREVEGLARLLRQAAPADRHVLEPIIGARIATLRIAREVLLARLLGRLDAAVAASVAAEQTVLRWIGQAGGTGGRARAAAPETPWEQRAARRAKAAMTRRIPAALAWLDGGGATVAGPRRLALGGCLALPSEAYRVAAAYVGADSGEGLRLLRDLLAGCRRFPNPASSAASRLAATREPDAPDDAPDDTPDTPATDPRADAEDLERARALALLDRPEALAALVELVADAWTRMAVRKAYALLGETARDDAAVAEACARALWGPPTRPWGPPEGHPRGVSPALRRQLVVAAGLLAAPCAAAAAGRLLETAGAVGGDAAADAGAALLGLALAQGEDVVRTFDELLASERRPGMAGRIARARSCALRGMWLTVAAGR